MATGPALTVALRAMRFARAAPLFGALDLAVPPGQVLALMGASGVGKTTLLRMMGGLETGFDGAVTVGGLPAALAPRPGFVFQDARLLPWLDAAGNIRAVCPTLAEGAIAALLTRVGLAGAGALYPRQMSGGMQRRLGLARALSVQSGLLLLDEPFASLNREVAQDLHQLFASVLRQHHPTVVLVSHDPEDAARLADRVVVLAGRPGRVADDFTLVRSTDETTVAVNADRIRAALQAAQT